jgi:hypothetical protein
VAQEVPSLQHGGRAAAGRVGTDRWSEPSTASSRSTRRAVIYRTQKAAPKGESRGVVGVPGRTVLPIVAPLDARKCLSVSAVCLIDATFRSWTEAVWIGGRFLSLVLMLTSAIVMIWVIYLAVSGFLLLIQ